MWKVKTRLKLIAVCIITERCLSILSQSLNKPLAIPPPRERRGEIKVIAAMLLPCSHSPPFYLKSLDLSQQDLITLCSPVYKFCQETERKIQFSTEERYIFFSISFHILFETWQEQNILRESDRAKLPAMYTWPCFLNYLLAAAPLKEAESVRHVPSHDSCKAILQVGFGFFFTALL